MTSGIPPVPRRDLAEAGLDVVVDDGIVAVRDHSPEHLNPPREVHVAAGRELVLEAIHLFERYAPVGGVRSSDKWKERCFEISFLVEKMARNTPPLGN